MSGLPGNWKDILRTRVRDWRKPKEPRMNYILGEHKEQEELKKWGFTKVYKMLIRKKLSAIDFSS